jgi:Arc/MetJ-type ribon-helix-helix transcriptional regulator
LNLSALIRDAVRHLLRRLEIQALEERDRQGYLKSKQSSEEFLPWESEAAWPEK